MPKMIRFSRATASRDAVVGRAAPVGGSARRGVESAVKPEIARVFS